MRRAQRWTNAALALGFVGTAVSACASAPKPPPAPSDTASAGAPGGPVAVPPAVAALETSQDASPPGATPPPASPSAAAVVDAPADTPDACAPVAMAYEKSLRAKLKQCWLDAANKSKDRIIGSIRLVLEIDNSGKIASQRLADKSDLPEPVQKCMLKAFKAEPIDGKKCDMKTFTIAEKFPR